MANNKWLGRALPRQHKLALFPKNVSPGSVWRLRIGSQVYSYEISGSLVDTMLANSVQQDVVDGLVSKASSSIGGGQGSVSVESAIVNGDWAIVVTGDQNGSPVDTSLAGNDATVAEVSTVELQVGSSGVASRQLIRWPKTPSGGTLRVGYGTKVTSVAFNASAAALKAAIDADLGIGTVSVTGDHVDGYVVEFSTTGTRDKLFAYSDDAPGMLEPFYDVTSAGGETPVVYRIDSLGGSSSDLFRFIIGDSQGHLFSGASTDSQIQSAVDSAFGKSVSSVSRGDGKIVIAVSSSFVNSQTFSISKVNGSATVIQPDGGSTSSGFRVLGIRLRNPVYSADKVGIVIEYGSVTVTTAAVAGTPPYTEYLSEINAAIDAHNAGFSGGVAPGGIPYRATAMSGTFKEGNVVITMQSLVNHDVGLIKITVPTLGCSNVSVVEVSAGSSARNSIQQVSLNGDPDGGTFTLTFGGSTTGSIAWNASAASLLSALEALPSVGAGNVSVNGNNGGPWVVEFVGALAGTSAARMTGSGALLTIVMGASVVTEEMSSPTGPNWWTNPQNWSLGTVPGATDTVVFDEGSISCSYGIDGVAAIAGLAVYRSFRGAIGLPDLSDVGLTSTLPRYLKLSDNGSVMQIDINLGRSGEGPSAVRIDTGNQVADVNVPYSQSPGFNVTHVVGLAGKIRKLSVGGASVGIATTAGQVATVDEINASVASDAFQVQAIGWGAGAVVKKATLSGVSLVAESVPESLDVINASADVSGVGSIASMEVRDSRVTWSASGVIGRSGSVTAVAMAGTEVRLTSAGHGLVSGSKVFIEGLIGVRRGYYVVNVTSANEFVLSGSSINAALFAAVYGGGSVIGSPQWGLSDSVTLSGRSTLEFAGSLSRTVGAPVLLKSLESAIVDNTMTVSNLSWMCDPGFLTESFGRKSLFTREPV